MTLRIGSLFSGIGGLELGIERATGGRVVWQVEREPFCRAVLAKHWPDATRFDDVTAIAPFIRNHRNRGRGPWSDEAHHVDIICGGFPCQDISLAGKGAGLSGSRSGLWREFARIVRLVRPRVVVVENVAALLARGLGDVLVDLAACGYDAAWDCVPAAAVGAPHRRDRLFIVAWLADSGDDRRERGAQRDSESQPGRQAVRARGDAAGRDDHVADASRLLARRGHQPAGADNARREGARPLPGEGSVLADVAIRTHVAGAADHHGGVADGAAQPRVGRGVDGLPGGLDGAFGRGVRRAREGAQKWPSRPGEPQHPWEPPRTARDVPHRSRRLTALGNAVVPQVAEAIGHVVAEIVAMTGGSR